MKGIVFDLECEGLIRSSQVEKRVESSMWKATEAHPFKDLDAILQNLSNDSILVFLPRST